MHVREVLGTTPGREPAHDRRLGGLLQGGRAARCSTTPSTSSTASGTTPTTPCKRCARPRTPGRRSSSCATPTAARCPRRSPPRVEAVRRQLRVELGIHCHNDCDVAVANTLAAVAHGRDAGAGDDQRHRRALRQRRPGQRHRQPGPEARPRGAAARQPGQADGGVALRLRDGQHELPHRPAVRRRQRLRPQGRHAHARRRPQHRPATSTSTRPSVGNERRILVSELSGPIDDPDQDDEVRHRATTGR